MARKEREKKYKKIVDNPMLYLEEHQHQMLPEEHQPEIHSLWFFGSGVEGAAIEVLALIDWGSRVCGGQPLSSPGNSGILKETFYQGKIGEASDSG